MAVLLVGNVPALWIAGMLGRILGRHIQRKTPDRADP